MLPSNDISHNTADNKYNYKQLQDFDSEINWDDLSKLITPHYLASSIGRLLVPTETMLRVYFLQNRYDMSASVAEEALFKVQVLREFALINLDSDVIPDEACIQSFYHLIEENKLESKLEESFNLETALET